MNVRLEGTSLSLSGSEGMIHDILLTAVFFTTLQRFTWPFSWLPRTSAAHSMDAGNYLVQLRSLAAIVGALQLQGAAACEASQGSSGRSFRTGGTERLGGVPHKGGVPRKSCVPCRRRSQTRFLVRID